MDRRVDNDDDDFADLLSARNPSTYSYQVESLNSNLFDYDANYGGVEVRGVVEDSEEERRAQAAPRVYDRYFDSSSDEESYPAPDGIETAGKRLDYMIQFLDRKLSSSTASTADGIGVGGSERSSRCLPEFVASGGGSDVFTVPVRAAVHPARPPSLEVRPHPLREVEIGKGLRTIVCSDTQLCAGTECGGVRVWRFEDLYKACGKGEEADDAAPFLEMGGRMGAGVVCMAVDGGNRLVWSGHRDGKIRGWRMDQEGSKDGSWFKEVLSWQAHRNPVLSIVLTSYGMPLICALVLV